jgi:hypothetical protein
MVKAGWPEGMDRVVEIGNNSSGTWLDWGIAKM